MSPASICQCGAPLSEHSIDGQYDGGCFRTRCAGYRERPSSPKPTNDLTPSEVALARVLAAWEEWQPTAKDRAQGKHPMFTVGAMLRTHGLAFYEDVTPDGRALLDRARKAGVV